MEIFSDMSPYRHMVAPYVFKDVFNIGWIDFGAYEQGDVPDGLLEKLRSLAFGLFLPGCIVEPARGNPICPVCGPLVEHLDGRALREAELWIPDGHRVFASPVQIVHFIQVHGYRPPDQYPDAVGRLSSSQVFDGDALYREKLKECGWQPGSSTSG